ncbi:MAG: DUF5819 family protein [Leucobacter sp.]
MSTGEDIGDDIPPPKQRVKPKSWVRVVALLAAVFTAWHVFASFLWIAPYSENAREVVPGDVLTQYMIPFFGQSWSVFAPEPINGDYHFNVRAMVIDENGDLVETGWVSATDVELSMIQYNLTPPRGGIQSSEVASSYKTAYDAMQSLQQTIVAGDFVVDDWEVGLEAALEQQVEATDVPDEAPTDPVVADDPAEADDSGEPEDLAEVEAPTETEAPASEPVVNTAEIDALLAEERRTTAYATQVARAIWGEDVQQVQYRVSRQNIIPFQDRHNPHAERPAPQIVLPGWRGPIVEESQNDKNFADVFNKQFERTLR